MLKSVSNMPKEGRASQGTASAVSQGVLCFSLPAPPLHFWRGLPSFLRLVTFFFFFFFLYSPIQSWLPQSDRQKAQGPFFLASHWNLSSRQQLLQGCQIDASLFCGLNEPSPPAASATNQCCCTSTAPGYHLLVPSPAPSRPP